MRLYTLSSMLLIRYLILLLLKRLNGDRHIVSNKQYIIGAIKPIGYVGTELLEYRLWSTNNMEQKDDMIKIKRKYAYTSNPFLHTEYKNINKKYTKVNATIV